jgi:hypothetical protein
MPFLVVSGDLSEPGVAVRMVEQALDAYGQIDTLVQQRRRSDPPQAR